MPGHWKREGLVSDVWLTQCDVWRAWCQWAGTSAWSKRRGKKWKLCFFPCIERQHKWKYYWQAALKKILSCWCEEDGSMCSFAVVACAHNAWLNFELIRNCISKACCMKKLIVIWWVARQIYRQAARLGASIWTRLSILIFGQFRWSWPLQQQMSNVE